MNFKSWLANEEVQQNKTLLLIHPDVIWEGGLERTTNYSNLLKKHKNNFDFIITHLFHPENTQVISNQDALSIIHNTINEISNITKVDSSNFGCTYSKELPEHLIENPNTTLFIAGGYSSNCVWRSYTKLFDDLDWLLKEINVNVTWYKPLLFEPHYIDPRQYQPTQFSNQQKISGNYHPDKINFTS